MRSSVAAATEPVREAAFAVEERVLWKGADRLRPVAEVARWPLERIGWAFERMILWPLQERTAGLAPETRGRNGSIAAVGAIVAGVVLLGIVLTTGGGGRAGDGIVLGAAPAASTAPATAAAEEPTGPVLHGAPPSFGVGDGVGVSSSTGDSSRALAAVGSGAATNAEGEEAAASTSGAKPAPAGPAAMKVARRFADAFVFYEIGMRTDRAETVFSETASQPLAEALAARPPLLPVGSEVPRAKVLNLVPGPRRGRAYTVSVSLIRVGVTSELRLEMQKAQGAWNVTDVRG